jgi:type II secretory pathway component PulF
VGLSAGFRRVGIQEPFLLTMMAMGEAQGDLARSFSQAATRYHGDVDRSVKVLSTLIEPMMIIGVGLIVGGIVISMLLPIFQLNFTVE